MNDAPKPGREAHRRDQILRQARGTTAGQRLAALESLLYELNVVGRAKKMRRLRDRLEQSRIMSD